MPHALSGADGENRSTAFCYIQANHDLDAVRAYLNRYRDQPKTLRAYTKELERFLLWAVVLRGKALSDLRVDDCEAYKDFLKSPDPRFVGERFARHSPRWRPFASLDGDGSASLSLSRSATRCGCCGRRSRGGSTCAIWPATRGTRSTIRSVIKRERAMKIERALPAELWRSCATNSMCDRRSGRRQPHASAQWRAVRAAILLMGDSGLRREEAA